MEAVMSCLGLGGGQEEACTQRLSERKFLLSENAVDCIDASDEKRSKTREFKVLVTGMGPYPKNPGHDEDGHYEENDNTSHLLTTLLPSSLPPFSKHNPTSSTIEILNPTSTPGAAVKTEYAFVRSYCKKLWKQYGNSVDLILHLGMADGWEWYAIEKSAWKEGTVKSVDTGRGDSPIVEYYMMPDDIGETYKDIPGPCPWSEEVPKQLFEGPGIDVDALAKKVENSLNKKGSGKKGIGSRAEVRPHPDGGNYLCGFISYESAAQRFVGGYKAKTMFCHIPGWRDKKRLEIGRDFVCALVGQIAADEN